MVICSVIIIDQLIFFFIQGHHLSLDQYTQWNNHNNNWSQMARLVWGDKSKEPNFVPMTRFLAKNIIIKFILGDLCVLTIKFSDLMKSLEFNLWLHDCTVKCMKKIFCGSESMKLNWNFQRGGGQTKKPFVAGYAYFLEQYIISPEVYQFCGT